jgi:hypothetical protein
MRSSDQKTITSRSFMSKAQLALMPDGTLNDLFGCERELSAVFYRH